MSRVSLTAAPSSAVTRRRVAWPVLQWPAPDQEAWRRARVSGDFLSEDGAAAGWRDATVRSGIGEYGRFMSFLNDRGLLDRAHGPAERVTPTTLRAYVNLLQEGRSSTTVASYIGVLGMMIQALCGGGYRSPAQSRATAPDTRG